MKMSGEIYGACINPAISFITDEGLFTDTGVHERVENERQSEHDCEMKTVS